MQIFSPTFHVKIAAYSELDMEDRALTLWPYGSLYVLRHTTLLYGILMFFSFSYSTADCF